MREKGLVGIGRKTQGGGLPRRATGTVCNGDGHPAGQNQDERDEERSMYIYRSEVEVEVEVVGSIYIEGFFGFCVVWLLCVGNTTNSPARKSTEFESVSRSEFFFFFVFFFYLFSSGIENFQQQKNRKKGESVRMLWW